MTLGALSLKCSIPKTLAFAFDLYLRSKTLCFKTHVAGRRAPNGGPKRGCSLGPCVAKRQRFKKKSLRMFPCSLGALRFGGLGLPSKTLVFKRFAFALLSTN